MDTRHHLYWNELYNFLESILHIVWHLGSTSTSTVLYCMEWRCGVKWNMQMNFHWNRMSKWFLFSLIYEFARNAKKSQTRITTRNYHAQSSWLGDGDPNFQYVSYISWIMILGYCVCMQSVDKMYVYLHRICGKGHIVSCDTPHLINTWTKFQYKLIHAHHFTLNSI